MVKNKMKECKRGNLEHYFTEIIYIYRSDGEPNYKKKDGVISPEACPILHLNAVVLPCLNSMRNSDNSDLGMVPTQY
jgi:hypothetical protein